MRNNEIQLGIIRDRNFTEQFTQTVKGVGTVCVQPSGKEIGTLFPRIPESGGVSGGELKLFYINL